MMFTSLLAVFLLLLPAYARTGCSCEGLSYVPTSEFVQFPAGTDFNILYNDRNTYGPGLNQKVNDGYCIVDGILTDTTASRISTAILNNMDTDYVNITGTNLWCYSAKGFTSQECVDFVLNDKQTALEEGLALPCKYPTSNFMPTDCRCNFECTGGYVKCGTRYCIDPSTEICLPSGIPAPTPTPPTTTTGCDCRGVSYYDEGAPVGPYPPGTEFNILYNDESVYGPGPVNKPNDGYCIIDGALTEATASKISAAVLDDEVNNYVNATGTDLWCYTKLEYTTREQCYEWLTTLTANLLRGGSQTDLCIYPKSNFIPTDCRCNFECTGGYVKCGTNDCIDPTTQVCQSGMPAPAIRRRSWGSCPSQEQSCPVGSNGWECVNTETNLESCGGCASQGTGVDCSALPGVANVQCRDGTCLVSSCEEGYAISFNECILAE